MIIYTDRKKVPELTQYSKFTEWQDERFAVQTEPWLGREGERQAGQVSEQRGIARNAI